MWQLSSDQKFCIFIKKPLYIFLRNTVFEIFLEPTKKRSKTGRTNSTYNDILKTYRITLTIVRHDTACVSWPSIPNGVFFIFFKYILLVTHMIALVSKRHESIHFFNRRTSLCRAVFGARLALEISARGRRQNVRVFTLYCLWLETSSAETTILPNYTYNDAFSTLRIFAPWYVLCDRYKCTYIS